ncbi:TetR/AcrR family transcriptional regulator [Clostridium neuense]|uniref:TetR/AcrR family transcriptional regulator n=1 Tax=Clostridium neuense TaxID=1728934 RepID=A0ABW8TAT1_9CLOT
MGIIERREAEKEALKKKIIDAASEILINEGYTNLSIRKIAAKIEYSPGIIYHYFKDKSEILSFIIKRGQAKVSKIINETLIDENKPENSIINVLKNYIKFVLDEKETYKAVLMNSLDDTNLNIKMLYEGVSKDKKSISSMCDCIQTGIDNGRFKKVDVELTAQIIWTSTYGLISRLIIEKNVPKEQEKKLIEHHLQFIINGLIGGKI